MQTEGTNGNLFGIFSSIELLRKGNSGIEPSSDQKSRILPSAPERMPDDRLIQETDLPPGVRSMLKFELDNCDPPARDVEDNTVGLAPSLEIVVRVEEAEPGRGGIRQGETS